MVHLYKTEKSAERVGRFLGFSAGTVLRVLKRRKVAIDGHLFFLNRVRKLPSMGILKSEYESGASISQLAKKYDASMNTVSEALNAAGAKKRKRGNVILDLPAEEKMAIVEMYLSGVSQDVVAESFRRGQPVISRILRTAGISCGRNQGESHPSWKGGRYTTQYGYTMVRLPHDDKYTEMCNGGGYVPEHRLILASHLGRCLSRHETVHHINGGKSDNRLENLQLRQGRHGNGIRHICLDCGSHNVQPTGLA